MSYSSTVTAYQCANGWVCLSLQSACSSYREDCSLIVAAISSLHMGWCHFSKADTGEHGERVAYRDICAIDCRSIPFAAQSQRFSVTTSGVYSLYNVGRDNREVNKWEIVSLSLSLSLSIYIYVYIYAVSCTSLLIFSRKET